MTNLRFVTVAIALFAAAFGGVSWAAKGFPVMTVFVAPLKPDARLPTFEENVKQGLRKDWEHSKTSQGDNDPGRNQMRLTTIQAANAYALSPCDQTIKAAFVVSVSTYMRAMSRSDPDTQNFSTPMDNRAREAIQAAFDAGGVTIKDFPKGTPLWGQAMIHSWGGDADSPCAAGRQADRRAR